MPGFARRDGRFRLSRPPSGGAIAVLTGPGMAPKAQVVIRCAGNAVGPIFRRRQLSAVKISISGKAKSANRLSCRP